MTKKKQSKPKKTVKRSRSKPKPKKIAKTPFKINEFIKECDNLDNQGQPLPKPSNVPLFANESATILNSREEITHKPEPEGPHTNNISKAQVNNPDLKSNPNHVQEYFAKVEGSREAIISKELFKDDPKHIAVRTELNQDEIVIINKLDYNDYLLQQAGLRPVFYRFSKGFMILKVSKDRKAREEYVNAHNQNKTDEVIQGMSNMSNIMSPKK